MSNEERISVSRDALRADLAEMELRLRTWIDQQLNLKADQAQLLQVNQKLSDLAARVVFRDGPLMEDIREWEKDMKSFSAGNFSEAQRRTLTILFDDNLKLHTDTGWTKKQRMIAFAALFVSILGLACTVALTIHYLI